MNQLARYIIIAGVITIIGFLVWYFSAIIAYILVSAVLSLMGKPIVDLLCRLKIRRWHFPRSLAAAITLVAIMLFFYTFFSLMIPLVANQANELSNVNVTEMVDNLEEPIKEIEDMIHSNFPVSARDFSVKEYVSEKLTNMFNATMISNLFSSTATFLINLFVALFSITFITYFFLKDESLFYDGILLLAPQKYEEQIKHALSSINKLLARYFIGIIIQSICIMILDTIGLVIVGIKFDTAIVIGLIAGILNVIPYVGPLTSAIIAVIIGGATNLHLDFSTQLMPLVFYIALVFVVTRIIDDVLFQPYIYSSSVNAHPLEVFIVILVAGSIAGILGMLLAIPAYTVLRVFAKEFFNKFRVVEKLTRKI